jgi:exonuclease III
VPRVESLKPNVKRGHGGVCLFFKDKLKDGIQVVRTDSRGIIWVKLCKAYFHTEHDIFVCFLYIPPSNSVYYNLVDTDFFEILGENIREFSTLGKISVMGDMNARCGKKSDIIQSSSDFDSFIHVLENDDSESILQNLPERQTMDHVVNASGNKLIELCISTDLKIVNGRVPSDQHGSFTYLSNNGNSLIDYALISYELFPFVNSFVVHDLTSFSSHRPINLILNLNYEVDDNLQFETISYEKLL